MRSFLNFLRSNLLLSTVMLASILLLVFGLLLIQASKVPAPVDSAQSDTQVTDSSLAPEPTIDIPPLPEIDRSPPADLPTVQAALDNMSRNAPQNSAMTAEELTAAFANAEPGSETWCDLMLLKSDPDWTLDESKLFAKRCI